MKTIQFMTSLLTFYLKGEIKPEQNFLKLKMPNTILTLIPFGVKNYSVPINQISSVVTNFKLLFKNFIYGIIETILGLCFLGSENAKFFGFILFLIGISTIINSFQTELIIDTTSGKEYVLSFLIFEKNKALQAESDINQMINSRLDDTNNRAVTENQTNTLVNAINNKNND